MPEPNAAELFRLAEAAGFVFRGKVARTRKASPVADESSQKTPMVTVQVEEVLRSTESLRGLAGSDVTLLGEGVDSLEDEGAYLFFTDCVVLADRATLREIGRVRATREAGHELAAVLRDLAERPLRARVASAELIIEGHVTASRKADPDAVQRSEHDPDWWIARVAVGAAMKGKAPKHVDVLFANSKDHVWFRSPKLHEGARGILLLHHARDIEIPAELPERAVYQATDPLDFLPSERMSDVQRMSADLDADKGGR